MMSGSAIAALLATPAVGWAQGGGDAADASGAFGEIVVTAQRREQRLQDVPISVSAFNQEILQQSGISDSTELELVTPGLTLPSAAIYLQPMIRGVGSYNTHVGDEPNVATYIDGVYISQMFGGFYNLANVERIEVLKGPQGTLFGRNATGGAINVKTRDPGQDLEGMVSLSYGRFNSIEANAYVQGGLGEGLAASLAGYYEYGDGYFHNVALNKREGGLKSYTLRSKILIEPSDSVRFVVTGDISRRDTARGSLYHVVNRNSAAETLGVNTTSGDYDVDQPVSPFNIVEQKGIALESRFEFKPFDVISISSYRATDQHNYSDSDGTVADLLYFDQSTAVDDYMQELRVSSKPSSSIQWIAGGFAYASKGLYNPLYVATVPGNPPLFVLNTKQKTLALAAFVDVTVPLTEKLSLAAGIRYSDESRKFEFARAPELGTFPNGKLPKATFSSWTPRAVLSYKPVDDVMVYASYSKGFKSGGYVSSSPTNPIYKPEKITAYEIGSKMTLGRGAIFNVAGFYYDYSDLQVSSLVPGVGTAIVTNATSARMKGLDADLAVRVTSGLTLRAGLAYNDAKYKSWEQASILVPRVAGSPGAGNRGCVDNSGTGGVNECDASGNRVARAPKFTFNFGGAYTHEFSGGYKLTASGNFYHNSGYTWEPSGRLRQGAYDTLSARLELGLPGDNVSFALWGKNLTNERYFINLAPNGSGDRGEFAEPVTYGASMRFQF